MECNLESRLDDEFKDLDGVLVHYISRNSLDGIREYQFFREVERYLGPWWDLFLKEYNIEGITGHCFETLYKHDIEDKSVSKCYDDTHLMCLFDLNGKAHFFQKYNGNTIVLHETDKYNTDEGIGGCFKVSDYRREIKDADFYIEETTKSKEFCNKTNIHQARSEAINYMQDIVDYHDAQTKVKNIEVLEIDEQNQNIFRIRSDTQKLRFCFEYNEDNIDFNELYEKEQQEIKNMKYLPSKIIKKIKNILSINKGCFECAKKPYRIMHHV